MRFPVTAETPPARHPRAPRKLSPTVVSAFQIEDLRRIDEWRLRVRPVPLQTWLALDGKRSDEVLCVNLSTADRIALWTVTPVQGGRARFAQSSPRRRSWSLETVADALEAIDAAAAFCVETA
jgi:hypothetical protein